MKAKPEGVFGVIKPEGPTSHDIIDRLREITGVGKIGHAGTLDPAASGVLVVAIGRKYTKKISDYRETEKDYRATVRFGKVSDTDDLEGQVREVKVNKKPTREEINEALKEFKGLITQKPPIYSAVKINGTASYKLARQGKDPDPPPRRVVVKEIDVIDYNYPELDLFITTGSGVYIRAIARDLGEKLKTGGLLSDLIRTRVGEFTLKKSHTLEGFKKEKPYI